MRSHISFVIIKQTQDKPRLKMTTEKYSRYDTACQKTLNADLFSTHFMFKLPDRRENYRTTVGSAFTILMLVTLLIYGSFKLIILYELSDYSITIAVQEYFFDLTQPFTDKDGFAIAATITAYDGSPEVIEDEEYATLEFYLKYWGQPQLGLGFDFKKLKSR